MHVFSNQREHSEWCVRLHALVVSYFALVIANRVVLA